MSWIKFSERKPKERQVITRFRGMSGGDCFETWESWKDSNLDVCFPDNTGHLTHWWDGEFNIDLAVDNWIS